LGSGSDQRPGDRAAGSRETRRWRARFWWTWPGRATSRVGAGCCALCP